MIVVLVIISIPKYRKALQTSREAVLRNNLRNMRDAIDQFTDDKQRAPESLQDLVAAGYFRQLPVDPMTNSNSSWDPTVVERHLTDVHSGSYAHSSNGTAYRDW